MISGLWTAVSRTIFTSGTASRIRRVASIPFVPGMSRSMRTTSGDSPSISIA